MKKKYIKYLLLSLCIINTFFYSSCGNNSSTVINNTVTTNNANDNTEADLIALSSEENIDTISDTQNYNDTIDTNTNVSGNNETNNSASFSEVISKPISEYTEADYIQTMCDCINTRYDASFTTDDIHIVNVSKADADTVFEAICKDAEAELEFKIYIKQNSLLVTDDYQRFEFNDTIETTIEQLIDKYDTLSFTDRNIIYSMNSKKYDMLEDYLSKSDTYLSFKIQCPDLINEDYIKTLNEFSQELITASYKFRIRCVTDQGTKTFVHDPLHKQYIVEDSFEEL